MWTRFMDMHSGGRTKVGDKEYIYIEAPQAEAELIFQNRFNRNPNRVTCACCGEDYSISEAETLEQATAYERNCRWIEDERGWLYGDDRPADYRDGRYIEADEEVPPGYRLSITWRKPQAISLANYIEQKDVLVIRADEIKPEERRGELRPEGYVWAE